MPADRTIGIRLTLEEANQFQATMKAAGADGQNALKAIAASADTASGSLGKVSGAVSGFGKAANDGGASVVSLTGKIDAARTAYAALATAAGQAAAAEAAAASNRAAVAAAQARQSANQYAGAGYSARAGDLEAAFAAADKLRASLVPLAAAEQQHAAQLAKIAQAEKSGVITANEAAAARTTAQKTFVGQTSALNDNARAHGAVTQAGKLANYQMIEIAETAHKFADQVISGGSAVKGLAYELPNAIAIAGGFKNLLGAIADVFTPFRIGALVAVGGIAAITLAAESADRRLVALRNGLRAYSSDFGGLADRVDRSSLDQAGRTGLSRSDVSSAQKTLLQANPLLTDAEVQKEVDLGRSLAVTLDKDLGSAMTRLAAMTKDPSAEIKKLSEEGVRGLSAELVRNIDLLQKSGQTAQAAKLGFDALEKTLGGAKDDLSPIQTALRDLGAEFHKVGDDGKSFAEVIGQAFERSAATAITAVRGWVQFINDARGAIGHAFEAPPEASKNVPTGDSYRNAGSTDFKTALGMQESGNNPTKVNSLGYTGQYQFGTGRLADLGLYQPAPGENPNGNTFRGQFTIPGFPQVKTQDDFRMNAQSQQVAIDAEIAQTRKAIADMGAAAKAFDENGLLGVSHLGGITGMQKFVQSGGKFAPADANGTSLADYYRSFARPGSTIPDGVPQYDGSVSRPGSDGDRERGRASFTAPTTGMSDRDFAKAAEDARGTLEGRRQTLGADIQGTRTAIATAQQNGEDAGTIELLNAKLRDQQAELEKLRSPIQEYIKGLRDQADASTRLSGASGEVDRALAELNKAGKDSGWAVTEADRAAVVSATLGKLSPEYAKLQAELARTSEATMAEASAFQRSNAAGLEAEARTRAMTEARKTFREGSADYIAAVTAGTDANLKAAQASAALAASEKIAAENEQLQRLNLQNALASSGAPKDQAAAQLRAFDTQQSLKNVTDPNTRSAAIFTSQQLQEAQHQSDQIKSSMDELSNFAGSRFDRIGASMVNAFGQGAKASKEFGSAMQSLFKDIEQELLKLAVINPIKNAIFGGNSPTISSVGALGSGFLGSMLGGGGGFSTAGAPQSAGELAFVDAAGASGAAGQASGGLFSGVGSFFSSLFHTGGIVGSGEGSGSRHVPVSAYYGAARLHSGGIADGEVPAVLQAGEGVFTKGQMAALGMAANGNNQPSGDTHFNFNVNAQGAGPREIEQLRSQIPLIAMQAVQSGMTRGGSFAKSVRGG